MQDVAAQRLEGAKTVQLYKGSWAGTRGAIGCGTLFFLIFAPEFGLLKTGIWFFLYMTLHAFRLRMTAKFFRVAQHGQAELRSALRKYRLHGMVGTAFWGVVPIVFFSPNTEYQVIVAIFVAGVCAAITGVYSATSLYLPCIFIGMGPLCLRFFYEGGYVNTVIALSICVFIVHLVTYGKMLHSMVGDALVLRFENADLLASLETKTRREEALNADLQQKIEERHRTEDRLKEVLENLETMVMQRTHDLYGANKKLEIEKEKADKAHEELEKFSRELEERVARRTEELATLNDQLKLELDWRKTAEELLGKSEKLHRMLVESAQDIIWRIDSNLKLMYVGPSVTGVLGYSPAELIDPGDPFAVVDEAFHDSFRNMLHNVLHEVDSSNVRTPLIEEIQLVAKSSERLWFEAGAAALKERDRPVGVLLMLREITRRKQIESELKVHKTQLERLLEQRNEELSAVNRRFVEANGERERNRSLLKAEQEKLRALLECVNEYVFVKDEHLCYAYVNPAFAELMEKAPAEILGKSDKELSAPEQAQHFDELEQRVLRGQPIESVYTLTFASGPRVIAFSRIPLRDGENRIVGICGVGRDSTHESPESFMTESASTQQRSAVMAATMEQIAAAARTDSIVLLTGESGVGKDYLAKFLHDNSHRARGPFFSINCAAVTAELAESELFGHESGAFTGAKGRKRGLVELAEGGTLLLNEIGELTPALQAKLLTFLDTQTFTRVGGEKTVSVDVRLIAATNRELKKEVENGAFRSDLYYRINVLAIKIPPLRERREDIPFLCEDLITKLRPKLGLRYVPALDRGAMKTLLEYHWPGNIRELRNVLERALITCDSHHITKKHVFIEETPEEQTGDTMTFTFKLSQEFPFTTQLENVKVDVITRALAAQRGNISATARLLGVSRDVLRHSIKTLGIDPRRLG